MENFNNFQRSVQNFGNQSSGLNDYISNFDSQFYSNWRDKVNVGQQQLDSAQKVLSGIGDAYVGAGLIGKTAKQIGARLAGDDSQEVQPPPEEEVGDNLTDTYTPLTQTTEGETSFMSSTPETVSSAVPTSLQSGELGDTATQQAILDTDPDAVAGLDGNIADTANVANESATALDGALDSVGTALNVAADVGPVALDFLGPVGLLSGIAVSLYEALDPHQRPSAPNPITANSKSELVVPSYDSVVDLPASNSAF